MRRSFVALTALLAFLVAIVESPAQSNPENEPNLLSRIRNLEERVAQLEETIKNLDAAASEPERTQTEANLIGTWIVVDAEKEIVSFPDMKFKRDGTCAVVWNPRPAEENPAHLEVQLDAKYEVIGTQLAIEHRYERGGGGISGNYRIVSITDDELVLSWKREGKLTNMTYKRAK